MSEYISKGIKDKDGNISRFEPPAPTESKLGGISVSDAEQIGTNKTNILTLKKHVTGDLTDSDFQEDSTVAMTKTVPSGMGNYAAIKVIGGKTVKDEENQVLKNAVVESVVLCGRNLWDGSLYNGFVNDVTGAYNFDTNYRRTNYIDISACNNIYIYTNLPNAQLAAFYDSDKKFISGLNGYNKVISVPSSAKYIMCTLSNISVGTPSKFMIAKSSEPTEYSPYYKTTLLLPDSIKNLPDWGLGVSDEVYNYVDFENMIYHRRVSKKKGKELNWVLNEVFYTTDITSERYLVSNYEFVNVNAIDNSTANSLLSTGQTTYRHGTVDRIYFKNTSISNLDDFKTAIAETEIVYTLATEELIDISDILHPIRVETGVTITFTNEHNLDVPNTIVYKKEVSLS